MPSLDSRPVNRVDEQASVVVEVLDAVGAPAHRPDLLELLDANRLRTFVERAVTEETVVVTGQTERRMLLVGRGDRWVLADLSGTPLGENVWPSWFGDGIVLADPGRHVSAVQVPTEVLARLRRPRLLLAALYHPEYFPLPRFPLGISDLARAARSQLCDRVDLRDMQLGDTLEGIGAEARSGDYDLVGISATFGQHDLQLNLLDAIYAAPEPPLVIAGGSLTVRNERELLERYPDLLIARGAGEDTVSDLVMHLRGNLERDLVRGIGYRGAAHGEGTMSIGLRRTGVVPNRARTDFLPELDLLDRTFSRDGVAQLEGSRGCTNFCSFCPRGHKGSWSGESSTSFTWIVDAMGRVLDRNPQIRRTVYMVDEEFIGRGPGTVERALDLAGNVHDAGMTWETSCRVDQVVHQTEDRDWHVERAAMWRELRRRGLKRCLFGIESGVTSILERFNKETTGPQNALAIRTLSALGVPTRFTYITFDHLMTYEELRATAEFQGRHDLVLGNLDHLPIEDIVDGVADPDFVAEHSLDLPFYRSISYMLVSMECLTGAAYTKQVQAAGLTGRTRPSMGRVDARFADWRIGTLSHHAQLWVDRNFALDYTMKSIEKVATGDAYEAIRDLRRVLKQSGFAVLEGMIRAGEGYRLDEEDPRLATAVVDLMDVERTQVLVPAMQEAMDTSLSQLSAQNRRTLGQQHARWASAEGWELINAADNCD